MALSHVGNNIKPTSGRGRRIASGLLIEKYDCNAEGELIAVTFEKIKHSHSVHVIFIFSAVQFCLRYASREF